MVDTLADREGPSSSGATRPAAQLSQFWQAQAVAIGAGEQHRPRALAIALGTTHLLVVGIQALRRVRMHYQPHVGLVHAEPERAGRHDDRRAPGRNSACVLWRALRAIEPWYGFAGTPSSVNAAASSSEHRQGVMVQHGLDRLPLAAARRRRQPPVRPSRSWSAR